MRRGRSNRVDRRWWEGRQEDGLADWTGVDGVLAFPESCERRKVTNEDADAFGVNKSDLC